MNPKHSLPLECQRYWNSEPPESLAAHAATCAACAGELEAREHMNRRLRLAHENVTPPPGLETRIRAAVRGQAPRKRAWYGSPAWAAAAAAVVLTVGYQLAGLYESKVDQDGYIASVTNRLAAILRPGVKDHIHCAVFRKFPAAPPPVEQFVAALGPDYGELVQVAGRHAPEGFRVVIGHKCKYQGRQFIHLALKKNGQLLSLVIAAKGEGESFATEQLRPALSQSGTPFYQASAQRFAVSAFETSRHLVYTVSDLPADQNLRVMLAMAPQVRDVLARAL